MKKIVYILFFLFAVSITASAQIFPGQPYYSILKGIATSKDSFRIKDFRYFSAIRDTNSNKLFMQRVTGIGESRNVTIVPFDGSFLPFDPSTYPALATTDTTVALALQKAASLLNNKLGSGGENSSPEFNLQYDNETDEYHRFALGNQRFLLQGGDLNNNYSQIEGKNNYINAKISDANDGEFTLFRGEKNRFAIGRDYFERTTKGLEVNGSLDIYDAVNPSKLNLYNTGGFANSFLTASAQNANRNFTLPTAAPSANQVLTASAVSGDDVTMSWSSAGASYSAGTGISISGTTITNTGDLSATNEIQTLSLSGQNLSLSNGGGTVTLPSGGSGGYVATEYASAGTFTHNFNASCKKITIYAVGGGGGGGSGRRGAAASVRCGGGGGGGGSTTFNVFDYVMLNTASVTVIVGAGGTGGTARTTDNSNGGVGAAGGDTYVRIGGTNIVAAGAGGAGGGGSTAAGLAGSVNNGMIAGSTGGSGSTTGTGGTSANVNNIAASGGGGGGGISSADVAGAGGGSGWSSVSAVSGVTANTAGSGANGTNGNSIAYIISGTGGGGGAASLSAAGGAGGNGVRGGGGGGGAGSLNGFNSGAGGAGGAGYVLIIEEW